MTTDRLNIQFKPPQVIADRLCELAMELDVAAHVAAY
jgi:hypothetical protein